MTGVAKAVVALVGLAVLAVVVSPRASRTADAQVAMWTSCRNVCMRSCQWQKGVMSLPASDPRIASAGNQCFETAACKKLHGFFAPSDPKVDRDAKTAALRLGQCKRCAATGTLGRCPADLFGVSVAPAGAGGMGYGGGMYGGAAYGGRGRDRIGDFARCFEQSVRDRIADGYHVKNYSFIRHVRAGGDAPALDRSRGGRSGEYGAWGMAWIKPCVDQFFPGAIVDELIVDHRSSRRKQHWRDTAESIYTANHRATRVVLPDGRRVVVDYWDGVGSGSPQLVPQTQWVNDWRARIGTKDAVLIASADEKALKAAVARLGAEKGFALFRKQSKRRKQAHPELWIASWKREPW